jgi:TMEM175 potassium channel family protein
MQTVSERNRVYGFLTASLAAMSGCAGLQEIAMLDKAPNPDRLSAFSDGVFAVIITILVLELKPPSLPTWEALGDLWPSGISYAVSYFFIAIVWINHHHLMRYADAATPRLIWGNFAHLFSVSLVPFSTAWIAGSRLAAIPVALYAGVFVLVNVTYLVLRWETMDRSQAEGITPRHRQTMRIRSRVTLGIFAAAAIVALKYPIAGIVLICLCLGFYVRPEAPKV